MKITDFLEQILKDKYLCDNCLGRQFASLLTGYTNKQRGQAIRMYLAFLAEADQIKIKPSNFYGMQFRLKKMKAEKEKCHLCDDIFTKVDEKAKRIAKKIEGYEFNTFLLGTNPPNDIMKRETEFWEEYGIEWAESINTEINREIGKSISKLISKELDRKTPDITILYDFDKKKIDFIVRSVFVYGKYQKLSRKMPQCRWKSVVYKHSVQSVIEKPLLAQTKGEKTSFHGEGREDVDVRCLGWRPFVIEVLNPKKRTVNISDLKNRINKSKYVKVKGLRIASKIDVKAVKAAKPDKTYRAIVTFENPVSNASVLKALKGCVINQQTPTRVIKRRADLLRKRRVKDIKYKLLSKNRLELKIHAQSGLYIKELIHGDGGRTRPSVQELLNNKVKNIELDVIKIHE